MSSRYTSRIHGLNSEGSVFARVVKDHFTKVHTMCISCFVLSFQSWHLQKKVSGSSSPKVLKHMFSRTSHDPWQRSTRGGVPRFAGIQCGIVLFHAHKNVVWVVIPFSTGKAHSILLILDRNRSWEANFMFAFFFFFFWQSSKSPVCLCFALCVCLSVCLSLSLSLSLSLFPICLMGQSNVLGFLNTFQNHPCPFLCVCS